MFFYVLAPINKLAEIFRCFFGMSESYSWDLYQNSSQNFCRSFSLGLCWSSSRDFFRGFRDMLPDSEFLAKLFPENRSKICSKFLQEFLLVIFRYSSKIFNFSQIFSEIFVEVLPESFPAFLLGFLPVFARSSIRDFS